MTFVRLDTPCLGTIAAQLKEARNRRFALLSLGWSLSLAWAMALLDGAAGQVQSAAQAATAQHLKLHAGLPTHGHQAVAHLGMDGKQLNSHGQDFSHCGA